MLSFVVRRVLICFLASPQNESGTATMTTNDIETDRMTVNALARREGVHSATCWRWMQHGIRSGIKLRSIRVGGRRYITEADWLAFSAALNADLADSPQTSPRSESRRRKDSDAALSALRRAGI